jgi:hypothetical protein
MQKLIPFLLILMSFVNAKSQVTDDFSDGDFHQAPSWTGDTSEFEVNSAKQLHLVSAGADTSVLATRSALITLGEWMFWIKLSFNTSANNFARIYLASDHNILKEPLNGYYLRLGGSDDSLSFVRQTGIEETTLFRGQFTCTNHSTNVLRIRVVHDSAGYWRLYTDGTGGSNFTEEGQAFDTTFGAASWFGVYCRYTSSNSAKFYFDDFYAGPIRTDTLPPVIDSVSFADPSTLDVYFSENVDPVTAGNVLHFSTRLNGTPVTATPDPADRKKIQLAFGQPFPAETADTLFVHDVSDLAGNTMIPSSIPFSNYQEKALDILMDEIMADPDPVNGLPESEYVELYNRTHFPISLKGWTFEYSGTRKTIPGALLGPGGYLILTKGIKMNHYGACVDLFTSYTTLSNEGTTLVLRNASGKVIHAVSYSSSWYDDPLKENGGWSLEMIDPENPCGCAENWAPSADVKGGTPGSINSVNAANPDTARPFMERVRMFSDTVLEILFSEPMDSLTLAGTRRWKIDGNIGTPSETLPEGPEYMSIFLRLEQPLEKKHLYTLSCPDPPSDCAGNLLDSSMTVKAGIPDSIVPGDLVINEILANPASGGEKFLELYNRSAKTLNLQELALGGFDSIMNTVTDPKTLSFEPYLSFPGDYAVVTRNPTDIRKRYNCPVRSGFVSIGSMPTLGSEEGITALARIRDGKIIDKVHYVPGMYSEILTGTDGISLERLNPSLRSDDPGNWHSASESCGFATPGYRNSEYLPVESGPDPVTISPAVFSPDGDGRDDLLLIQFTLDEAGYQVSITIFDQAGMQVRDLARNRLLSTQDALTWNGCDDRNLRASPGIYLLFIELVKPEGKIRHIKKIAVLGGRR